MGSWDEARVKGMYMQLTRLEMWSRQFQGANDLSEKMHLQMGIEGGESDGIAYVLQEVRGIMLGVSSRRLLS